ncbi:MAG: Cytosine/purine/uracil/thiamine/allantoin permease family protein [uncultured Blastococcus sp.]|uniref:Cytosine/purine/uracil/thiamine/allantoin permease family protein n=1 Tax=uncultured Blastococcus sp. TaxID=217144 RepID=A0A6J4ICP1_9ACTN|nr:MAG: Cytosine/purine/uracil/thiamine/allantoin permease family protein [uncultured Blastococcus sp.]
MNDAVSTPIGAHPSAGGRPPAGIEAHSIDWIPAHERRGKVWQQAPFWFLTNFHPLTVALGLIGPSLGLSLGWTILAATAGVLFGTLFMALHGAQGPTLGLPQMIQSRAQLGYRGVSVVLIATLFTFLGYNIVNTVLIGDGLSTLFSWNATATGIGIGVLAVVLAVWGHDWLHRAFRVLFWLSLPFWVLLTVGALTGQAGGQTDPTLGFSLTAFVVVFTAGASYNITYAPIVSDYTRYLPENTSPRRLICSVYCGASISAIWMMALGAWLGARLGVSDTLVGIHDASNEFIGGTGTILVATGVLALIATMGLNGYSAVLTVLTATNCFRSGPVTPRLRIAVTVVLGLVWTVLGVWVVQEVSTALNNALLIMLYLLTPWTAVNLVDYFVVRRGHYNVADLFNPRGQYGQWAPRGLTAYGLGLAAEVPFMVLSFYEGPLARSLGGVDVAFVFGLAVAGLVFLALSRGTRSTPTQVPPSAPTGPLGGLPTDTAPETAATLTGGAPVDVAGRPVSSVSGSSGGRA